MNTPKLKKILKFGTVAAAFALLAGCQPVRVEEPCYRYFRDEMPGTSIKPCYR